ncbi:unnamed protein product [Discula destructiva]
MPVAHRSRTLCRAIATCQLLSSAMVAAESITISLSAASAPATQYVDRSFAGFGIEPSNLFSFTGGADTNSLSINLLDNLGKYTGKPPHIRLGGNTEDYMIYDASHSQYQVTTNPDPTGNGSLAWDLQIIGPTFFEAANRFPTDTPITWGLNLAYNDDDYIDRIVTMAQQVIDRCTNLDIVSFEIGNEPDLYYASSKFRDETWTGAVYTQQWLERAAAIYEQVLQPKGIVPAFFEAGATSHTSGTTFAISQLVSDGITQAVNGSSYVTTWTQHDYTYFYGVATYDLTLDALSNFETIENQFLAQAEDQLTQSNATSYGYALREMGWVGPAGAENVTDTFGGALYTLNFLLYGAANNLTGVNFHMTEKSFTAAWQPITVDGVAPHPRPLYYGHAAFNQIIGPTCTAQVSEYILSSVPSGYDGYLSAYTIFQAGTLSSIAILNSKQANSTQSDIANLTVSLTLPTSMAGKTVHLAYLTNDGLDSKFNTTWNGISYEQSGDGTPTTVSDTDNTATVGNDGSLNIAVRDSQAVVAQIGSQVGSLTADETACSAVASTGTYNSATASSATTGRMTLASSPSAMLAKFLVPCLSMVGALLF